MLGKESGSWTVGSPPHLPRPAAGCATPPPAAASTQVRRVLPIREQHAAKPEPVAAWQGSASRCMQRVKLIAAHAVRAVCSANFTLCMHLLASPAVPDWRWPAAQRPRAHNKRCSRACCGRRRRALRQHRRALPGPNLRGAPKQTKMPGSRELQHRKAGKHPPGGQGLGQPSVPHHLAL